MPYPVDVQFDKLAQETLSKAAKIKCSPQEYAEGLQQIAEELLMAADAAEVMDNHAGKTLEGD